MPCKHFKHFAQYSKHCLFHAICISYTHCNGNISLAWWQCMMLCASSSLLKPPNTFSSNMSLARQGGAAAHYNAFNHHFSIFIVIIRRMRNLNTASIILKIMTIVTMIMIFMLQGAYSPQHSSTSGSSRRDGDQGYR